MSLGEEKQLVMKRNRVTGRAYREGELKWRVI